MIKHFAHLLSKVCKVFGLINHGNNLQRLLPWLLQLPVQPAALAAAATSELPRKTKNGLENMPARTPTSLSPSGKIKSGRNHGRENPGLFKIRVFI